MATTNPINKYLATLDEPKRATLTSLRDTIMAIVPEAEQGISYGMPAFKLRGKTIAGFAAFKNHLSYLPHSGSVIPQLAEETAAYTSTKGSLHFPGDEPLPRGAGEEASRCADGRSVRQGVVPPTGGRPTTSTPSRQDDSGPVRLSAGCKRMASAAKEDSSAFWSSVTS